jgi:uncharacterized protein
MSPGPILSGGIIVAYFFLRLNPPRLTFAQDMTDAERQIMREHVAYWFDQINKGTMLIFGPVNDPKGGWGLGILDVKDAEAARALTRNDPVIIAGTHTVEILPMATLVRK